MTSVWGGTPYHLLPHAEVFIDDINRSLHQIRNNKHFYPYKHEYVNIGTQRRTVWITLRLKNDTDTPDSKAIVLTSPLIETAVLYDMNASLLQRKGTRYLDTSHHSLQPYFTVTLPPASVTTYYIRLHSHYTPLDTALILTDEKTFIRTDRQRQFQIILLIGFILALALYSFVLFFYTKDRAYAYYALYLLALIYQQMTYLGLTQIYLPDWLNAVDLRIPVVKITLLIVTAALFAMHFLKIKKSEPLHRIYRAFIFISFIEMALLNLTALYNLDAVIFTGAAFITFNLVAGIIRYKQGFKEARFFVIGFTVVFFSYMLIIFDALGLTSIMQRFQSLLIYGTAFEALVLSLAFADRYLILRKEKAKLNRQIKEEYETREKRISQEVSRKTEALNRALHTKELLVREIHHRVKNNLQLILSILRLQRDESNEPRLDAALEDLEHRINAIAKSYEMLLTTDKLEDVDMGRYIRELIEDIRISYGDAYDKVHITIDANITMPLKQAVYLGLVINELVTNAFKHAFKPHRTGELRIALHRKNKNIELIIEDSGGGYEHNKSDSLGLALIKTLIYQQLNGTMHYERKNARYNIEVPPCA
jgi:two-component sensor histidine kinase